MKAQSKKLKITYSVNFGSTNYSNTNLNSVLKFSEKSNKEIFYASHNNIVKAYQVEDFIGQWKYKNENSIQLDFIS